MSVGSRIREVVESSRDELVALSHFIHAHPEIGYEEFASSAAVADALEAAGYAVERGVAGRATALRATAGAGDLHVVVCAEYDALPEVGHACGHNLIAASAVGCFLALAPLADELGLRVSLFGTPSEEGGGGKIDMIEAGLFADVHAAFMIHPWAVDRLEGEVLAVDHFDVTVTGREAHASAAPWVGANALDALTVAQVAIGLLRQHLAPGDQVHGVVLEGGTMANVVPSHTVARYMARSRTVEGLDALRERLAACFEAGALATGTTVRVDEVGSRFTNLVTDPDLISHYRRAAEQLGRTFDLDDAGAPPERFSTDMGNVSLVVPSIHPLLGLPTGGAVNHQPAFAAACVAPSADAALVDGALALAFTIAAVAQDEPLRARLLARTPARG